MARDPALEDLEQGLGSPKDVVDRRALEVVGERWILRIFAVDMEDLTIPVVRETTVWLRLDVQVIGVQIGHPVAAVPLVLLDERHRRFSRESPPRHGDFKLELPAFAAS